MACVTLFAAVGGAPARSQQATLDKLQALMAKVQSSGAPCPYLPQMKQLMRELASSDSDTYTAMKPVLDEFDKSDADCAPAKAVSAADTAAPAEPAAKTMPTDGPTYSGPDAAWVHTLLQSAGSYACPTTPPPTPSSLLCQRDGEVAKATQLAWAAECESRAREPQQAIQMAGLMMTSLQTARQLCESSAIRQQCDTEARVPCRSLPGASGAVPDPQNQIDLSNLPQQQAAYEAQQKQAADAAKAAAAAEAAKYGACGCVIGVDKGCTGAPLPPGRACKAR